MSMGEAAGAGLLQAAIRHTAAKLGSHDVESKRIDELLEEICRRDPETYRLLVAFADAYCRWYRLQQEITQALGQPPIRAEEQARLAELARDRDSTREAVLRRLHSL